MMITYTNAPECDLGLIRNPTGGPPQFWVTSKCQGNARFHIVEFPTTTASGILGKRSDIWDLVKGAEGAKALLSDTKLVVVYRNGEEILNCAVDLRKAQLLSVDRAQPEQAEAEEEFSLPVTTPAVETSTTVATVEPPKAKASPRKRTKSVVEPDSPVPTATMPAKPPRKRTAKQAVAASG